MTTTIPPLPADHFDQQGTWSVSSATSTVFQWDYDTHDEQLLRLYAQGKERQWDAAVDLDWSRELDPANPLGIPDTFIPIADTELWRRLPESDRATVRRHTQAWSYSQTLHGEQFALMGLTRVCTTVDDIDAKLFAATQIMDEARHVEGFNRLVTDKIGIRYPLCAPLQALFEDALRTPEADLFVIASLFLETLALVMLNTHRSCLTDPLGRTFTEYVARDESRHIAFGRLLLRRRLAQSGGRELRQHEDFALECCRVLEREFGADPVWETLGFDRSVAVTARTSIPELLHRRRVFRQVIPSLQDVGLFSPYMREHLRALNLLHYARRLPAPAPHPVDDATDAETEARRHDIEAIARYADADIAPTR
ncbi:diiron oxygenase [Streptomyces sp. NPDC016562]|uniref:diiron oxygenase n=1 Tax=Streptomyces sp. NPDC016562 TaxID=3364966 RepID=UPI0036FBA88F